MSGVSQTDFLDRVSKAQIVVTFGDDVPVSPDGQTAAEMIINLLARLLPGFAVISKGRKAESYRLKLQELALAINPLLELRSDTITDIGPESFEIVLGQVKTKVIGPRLYVGADGWAASISTRSNRTFGNSSIPFGSAAAGCIAVANLFRHLFRDVLENAALDSDLNLSLRSYDQPNVTEAEFAGFSEAHLVGAGAIGNATIWTLGRMRKLSGVLHIIDPEDVELSNLQRYVLTTYASPGQAKVAIARTRLADTGLDVRIHALSWGEYLAERNDYCLDLVAVGLDSAHDRIEVQGSLPRRIVNAWTQRDNLGVSRHFSFGQSPCLACLYFPEKPVPNEDEEIMRSLKLPPEETMHVRDLLYTGRPLDPEFVSKIAHLANKTPEVLEAYVGKPLRALYSGAVCGGLLLDLNGSATPAAEVPMPFQSAMAGVMLAAELVQAGTNRSLSTTTTINLLRPIPPYLSFPRTKIEHCICGDRMFLAAYEKKWGPTVVSVKRRRSQPQK